MLRQFGLHIVHSAGPESNLHMFHGIASIPVYFMILSPRNLSYKQMPRQLWLTRLQAAPTPRPRPRRDTAAQPTSWESDSEAGPPSLNLPLPPRQAVHCLSPMSLLLESCHNDVPTSIASRGHYEDNLSSLQGRRSGRSLAEVRAMSAVAPPVSREAGGESGAGVFLRDARWPSGISDHAQVTLAADSQCRKHRRKDR